MLKRFPVLSGFVCICRGLCGTFVCMLGYAHMEFDIIVCLCFIADRVNTAGLHCGNGLVYSIDKDTHVSKQGHHLAAMLVRRRIFAQQVRDHAFCLFYIQVAVGDCP